MRLLFDEQLSARLCSLLSEPYPGSLHVRQIGLCGASDEVVWRTAAERDCVLVTKDEDFHRLSVLRGAPPKVIWLRLGNTSTEDVAGLLRAHRDDVLRFVSHDEATFLALGAQRRVRGLETRPPDDTAGAGAGGLEMTPDGRHYVYTFVREPGELFVVEGLR